MTVSMETVCISRKNQSECSDLPCHIIIWISRSWKTNRKWLKGKSKGNGFEFRSKSIKYLSVWLSVCLFLCFSVCLSVCLSIYLSINITEFELAGSNCTTLLLLLVKKTQQKLFLTGQTLTGSTYSLHLPHLQDLCQELYPNNPHLLHLRHLGFNWKGREKMLLQCHLTLKGIKNKNEYTVNYTM